LFHPIAGEYDLIGKNPEAGHTIKNIGKYESTMEEMRTAIAPELELIESRIVAPVKDFQTVLKTIRKTITKRDHKVGIHYCASIRVVYFLFSSQIMIGSTIP
jgi:amphiphysin